MLSQEDIHQQVLNAIFASQNIITSLQSEDLEAAQRFDDDRIKLIRTLSNYQNFEKLLTPFHDELIKLAELDKAILSISEKLRDETLTHIREDQSNRLGCVQYAQNQRL